MLPKGRFLGRPGLYALLKFFDRMWLRPKLKFAFLRRCLATTLGLIWHDHNLNSTSF